MDDWLIIIALSLAMLVGCYVAGCIPLMFSLSEEKLKIVTIFGAGLLVGTALCIIIPEGIDSMYHTHKHVSHTHEPKLTKLSDDVKVANSDSLIRRQIREVVEDQKPELKEDHSEQEDHDHSDNHKLIGVTLVFGFVFMLLVDQIGGGGHSHGAAPIDVTNSAGDSINMGSHTRHRVTATVGLCVHAAADGVALGAATSVKQAGLTLIVFIAIMLHKAPAAFGLVSFLLHDNMDRARIRKHLLAFSLAAPIGSLLTYFILNHQNKEWLAEWNATGLAMLFSAGTFLYVATVHILPEVSSKSSRTVALDGTVIIREHKGFDKTELFAIVLGSVLPVGISLGHSHAH